MYTIRDKKVCKAEIIKESNRGTASWCKIEGFNKSKLVSHEKMFNTKEEALKALGQNQLIKKQKEKRILEETNEIEKIVFKAMEDFNIVIKLLDRPATLEDAKEMYNKLKEENMNLINS